MKKGLTKTIAIGLLLFLKSGWFHTANCPTLDHSKRIGNYEYYDCLQQNLKEPESYKYNNEKRSNLHNNYDSCFQSL